MSSVSELVTEDKYNISNKNRPNLPIKKDNGRTLGTHPSGIHKQSSKTSVTFTLDIFKKSAGTN